MGSMMKKTSVREIKGTFGRFAAILAIIALGVGFFSGVRITTPAMVNMMNEFIDEKNLFDYRLISTLGWENEDVENLRNQPDVVYAEGANSLDVLYVNENNEEFVLKTHSLTNNINGILLKEGRMPQNDNECVIDRKASSAGTIGSKLHVSEENEEDTVDSLKYKELTIVGIADSSYYINFERGNTSIGNGSVAGFVYITPEAFDVDYYTEIFVKFDHHYKIYSDEYNDYMDGKSAQWEDLTQKQADSRYDRIMSDAESELQDGRDELDDKRKEGQQELDDAKKELSDAEKELNDAEKELSDAEKELNDGKKELDDAKKNIDDGQKELDDSKKQLDDAEKELADAKQQIDDGQEQLDEAKIALDEAKQTLDDSEQQLIDGENQLNDGQAQLDNARNELNANEQMLIARENELNAQENAFNQQYGSVLAMIDMLPPEQQEMLRNAQAQIAEGRSQINAAKSQIEEGKHELAAQQAVINEKRRELESGRAEFEKGKTEYEQGLEEYENSLAELEKGKQEYEDGMKEYQEGRKKYEDGLKEFEDGKKEYEDALKEYEDGKQKYEDGLKELEDGKKEYQDGLSEYEDGLKEFDEKIADAEKEISDAEKEIADIEKPETYVLGRNTNIGYACFENDSEIVEQVARVFPIFFILVAALVCMTTMSRMVEEQRTQIGVFKALGYSEGSIMGKFMFYSGSAALIGCTFGYAVGTVLFPKVIWMTYKLMYVPLDIPYLFEPILASVAVAVSLICSVGTTWISCRYELSETAATLMRPKAPKAGKRVFLERISFIWNNLKFLYKVSIRNIFRYKGRFFMMIIGIGGCTALLLTGFGLKDSVAGFADVQYDEVQITDASISFKSDKNGDIPKDVKNLFDEYAEEYTLMHGSSWDLVYGNKTKSITLEAIENFDNMSHFMNFRTVDGETLDYPNTNEALVSHSIAERYGAKLGDDIVLRDEDMNELHLTVTGIFENHVYNYIFINTATMREQLSEAPELNSAYVNFPDNEDKYKLCAEIYNQSENVTGSSLFQDVKERMANTMSSLNYIVLLVIVCAAGLAFIVIYNLTNINITERIREIATIKVLGFFKNETSAYVLRENIALTAIGILFGTILGKLLHSFVMAQIIVDLVDFRSRILPMSYIYSIILTFVFNFIVNIFMELKLEKINMAESLKSVD